MNRFKKATFGVLIAGLAFGFSAFTTLKKRTVYVYYKADTAYPIPSDSRGYKYYSEDRCEAGGNVCTAQWDIGSTTPPLEGTPLPSSGVTFQTGSVASGHFE